MRKLANPRPGVFKQGFQSQESNDDVPILRECWPTVDNGNKETPGCSIQEYKGAWYNICRSVVGFANCIQKNC